MRQVMGPSGQAELSKDERLSPIKFPGLRNDLQSNQETNPPQDSEHVRFRANPHPNSTPSRAKPIHRRNTLSSLNTAKTPIRVQKVTSSTTPRRHFSRHALEGFTNSPVPYSKHSISSTGPRQSVNYEANETETAGLDSESNKSDVSRPESINGEKRHAIRWGKLSIDACDYGQDEDVAHIFPNQSPGVSSSSAFVDEESDSIRVSRTKSKSSKSSFTCPDSNSQDYPIFTSLQFEEIQHEQKLALREFETILTEKNSELIRLASKISGLESSQIKQQESFIKNQNEIKYFKVQQKALEFQINQYVADLNHTKEVLKQKTALLKDSEKSVNEIKEGFKKALAEKNQEFHITSRELKEANMKLVDTDSTIDSMSEEIETFKITIKDLDKQYEGLKKEYDTALADKESAIGSFLALQEDLLNSNEKVKVLELEIKDREATISDLRKKFDSLTKETETLHEDMLDVENEQKKMEFEVLAKSEENLSLKANEKRLQDALSRQSQQLEDFLASDRKLKAQLQVKEEQFLELRQKISDLEAQNGEKDKIISGDTKKLRDLVQQVTDQKNLISDQKAQLLNSGKDAELTTRMSEEKISKLRQQISSAQEKTDQRIQEVAEQLYHQYSKKHEAKVNQLKVKYEGKLEEKGEELKRNERLVESLQSQLKTEMKEKTYLLGVLEKSDKASADKITQGMEGVM